VTTATYCFAPDQRSTPFGGTTEVFTAHDPEDHVPGQTRWMTGALLTEAGQKIAEAEEAEEAERASNRARDH